MIKKTWFSIFAAAALCLCFSGIGAAQEITGSLVGSVKDSAGAAVVGATVTVTDQSKKSSVRTVTTNDDGTFSAANIPVGTYTVTVEAANFKKSVNTDVKVDVGLRRSVEVSLAAGNIAEVVTVQADQVAVETNTPQASTTINGDQVRELSINNRNFVQLVTLAPGVSNDLSDQVYVGTTNPAGQANTINISVNGARSSQNTFTVDGADITDRGSNITIQAYPSVDSISEFRVLRSLYPAESGRSGGGQVNVVTRSGSDKFRGSAFYFLRNESFNANDPLTNSTPGLAATLGRDDNGKIKRTPFRYKDYGFTFGGPVYFLKFGERDPGDWFGRWTRTFFFFSLENRDDTRFPTLASTVPTALQRAGRFDVPICLQASGTTCTSVLPGTTATPGQLATINPIAQQYLTNIYNKLPLPNTGVNSLNFPIAAEAGFRQQILRVDHAVNDKLSFMYRYERDKIPTTDANSLFSSGTGLPDVATTQTDSPGRTHTFQGLYTASPNLIFEGLYTFGYGAILSHNIGLLALTRSPITPPLPYQNQRDRVPTISGNGFSNLSSFGPYNNFSWKGNVTGNVTWIKENHTLKFGAVYSKYRKNENALAGNNEGIYSGFNTPGTGVTTNVIAPGGNATQQLWANFLMGTNVSLTQASFDYTADLRQMAFEGYAQDEWKIRRNITLYLGMRYSFFGSPIDKNGRLSNFDPSLWSAAAAPSVTGAGNRVPGTGNFCNGMIVNAAANIPSFPNCTPTISQWGGHVIDVSKKDFAPRFGIAWDPWGDGKTAIRTGYGIYHEQVLNGTFEQNIGTNPPFQQTCAVTGVSLDNPTPGGCAIAAANTANNVRAVDPNWKTPYMQHWSLDVQRQLTSRTLITVGYFGSKGTHLIGGFELNDLRPGQALGSQCAVGASTTPSTACQVAGTAFFSSAAEAILDQLRPYRGYRSITIIQPRYNSTYHSLQVSGTHRFTGASQLNVAYTWSKNLTDNPNDRSASPQNTYDTSLDYARATLDRRHVFTANFIYELPWFDHQHDLAGLILGGWQTSSIITFQTGLGFTPTVSGFDPAGLGLIPQPLTTARPNLTCDPNAGAANTPQQWFNTSCFQVTPIANTPPNGTGTVPFANVVGTVGRGIIQGPGTQRVDLTLTKNFHFNERFRLQLRAEAFNVFNWTNPRTLSLGVWSATTQPVAQGGNGSSTFGQVTAYRDPRIMQFGAKLYF